MEHIWISSDEVDEPKTYYTEWSESEKDKYCILVYIYGIQKNGSEEFINRAAMEKQTSRIDLWTWEEGRRGWDVWKSNTETYITIYKLDSQWEFDDDSGNSNGGSVST